MLDWLTDIAKRARSGKCLSRDEALRLANDAPLEALLYHANRLRETFHGDSVHLCSILNARSGACSENCKFCAQSAHHTTGVATYPLVAEQQMVDAAHVAAESGSDRFGIVTSGESVGKSPADLKRVCSAVRRIHDAGAIAPCVSIGTLRASDCEQLKAAGIDRIHHNLETSERFFPQICTSHAYADRVATVRAAKAAGLQVCCGGLFGLGETWADRVDLARRLRELEVDAVPINFLMPLPGTPMADRVLLPPREALRLVALFRFILPTQEIKVCGGRDLVLRDLQSWIFRAGASGMMIGNYLTTRGRSVEDDLQMLADLGLRPRSAGA
jgi:biotin synthase